MSYDVDNENMIKAFSDFLADSGRKIPNIVVLNSDFSKDMGVGIFAKNFSDRFFHFGLGVNNMVSASAGFAVSKKLAFVSSFSSYLTSKCYDQIKNDICFQNLNIKLIGHFYGFSSAEIDNVAYQSFDDIALMSVLPNMKILCPADYYEAYAMLNFMSRDFGPTYLRLAGGKSDVVFDEKYNFEFGKAIKLREGKDLCIFATGDMVYPALKVADKFLAEGIAVGVVNVGYLKPIDEEGILKHSVESQMCVSLEDHGVIGGLGSAIAQIFQKNGINKKLQIIGMEDKFPESARRKDLLKKYGLDEDGVYAKIKGMM